MKIRLVGTGSLTAAESSACSLIDDKILVDCGNGIVKTLLRQERDLLDIEALLVTHFHGDHVLDIPFLILIRSFSLPARRLKIYGPEDTKKKIALLVQLTFSDIAHKWEKTLELAKVDFIEFDHLEDEEVLPGYKVSAYSVIHGDEPNCYGYTVEHEGKVAGFSGDSALCEGIEQIVSKADVSILDMSFVRPFDSHMCVEDIEKLLKKYDKLIIPTHMNKFAREEGKKINNRNLLVLTDGGEIEL